MHLTTYTLPEVPGWEQRTFRAVPSDSNPLKTFAGLLRASSRADAVILRGTASARDIYADIFAAAAIARRGRQVLLVECTWHEGSKALAARSRRAAELVDPVPDRGGRIARSAISALDTPNTHYCVLSEFERERFPQQWGVDPGRVHLTPSCVTTLDTDYVGPADGGVFAGGNNMRDYRALAAVAAELEVPVQIATNLARARTTGNLTIGLLAQNDYERAARDATVVVVPMIAGAIRSAGQQTFLNAMVQGKPVVVTDVPGVRDYVDHDRTGVIVPPEDPPALSSAVRGLLAEPERAVAIGRAAREDVLRRFTRANYYGGILELADRVAGTGMRGPADRAEAR